MTASGDGQEITGTDEGRRSEPVTHSDGAPPPPGLSRGRALGRYLVVERLGAGGMGVVYRAFDPDLDRSVALKLVTVSSDLGSESDHERTRLLREAQAMARLSHPNVIPVFDVGILDDAVFVAMELVDGVTLGRWIDQRPRRWDELLPVFLEAGRGLAAAHAADLVHRDFKPDNVMVGHDGRVRVLDFGLARTTRGEPTLRRPGLEDLRVSTPDSLERSMTAAGVVLGTPAYMSPEQHLGGAVDATTDQFGFCVALFEAVYGARPFAGNTMATLSLAVVQGNITMPAGARGKAPGRVLDVLTRGLAVDPSDRFPTMTALLEALAHDPAHRRRRIALGLGVVGALGLGAVLGATLDRGSEADAGASTLCTGAPAAMASVWSPERRESIGAAFDRSGVGFAAETWASTAALLDRRARAWVNEHTEACRATRVTGEQSTERLDLRMSCLARQRQRFDALVRALVEPDAESIASAFDAARRLPPAERCGDLEALRVSTPPPEDPEARKELATLWEATDAVRARFGLGHVTEARPPLERLLPRVDALDYPPLSSEVLGLHAELLEQTGDIDASRQVRERAYAAAVAAGDSLQATEHAQGLVFTVGYRLADQPRGEFWLALALASLRRSGGDARLRATLHSNEGAMRVAAGQYREALASHTLARAYWEEHDPSNPELAAVLDDIGAVHITQGEPERAIELHRESLRLKRDSYGEHHPQVAASMRELGSAFSHALRWDDAIAQFEAALAIEREARGHRTQFVAALLDDIGRVLRRQDRLEEAIEHHRRALAIWEAVLGDPHPDLAVSVLNVGYTLNAAGRFEDALAQFRRALAMFEASVGSEHPYIVYASNSVAAALVDLRRYAEARAHLERVLAIEGLTVDPTLIAETKFTLTHALWADGSAPRADRARARRLAEQARLSYQTHADRWGPQLEQIEQWLEAHR